MKEYDVVVLGAGDVGLAVAFKAAAADLRVALIEKAKIGGTCANYGCVPSKTLIYAADLLMEIAKAREIGISAEVSAIDFKEIMERMRRIVRDGGTQIRGALEEFENLAFFNTEAFFIDDRTIEAAGVRIRGNKIFIASGSRPKTPNIKGLDSVPWITNETLLQLDDLPESMIILGGGYVGVEYAHFFSAMGSRVTVADKNSLLLPFEDREISELFTNVLKRRVDLRLNADIQDISSGGGAVTVTLRDIQSGATAELSAACLMLATGRESNADLLKPGNAGIEIDDSGFIKVDDYLQTNKKHIWALGDAIGKAMFTHAGDREAEIAWSNATGKNKTRMDFGSVPHAVFSFPQIASVGMTEEEARKDHDVQVGRAKYSETVMGEAMAEDEGFAKAVVDKNTGRILGFHIVGPHAAILIQEVVNAKIHGSDLNSITDCMHIFPALSNLIPETLENLE